MGEKDKMFQALAKAERILEIKNTNGWKEDIKPKLEKMISNATGGLIEGKWYPGKVFKKDATDKEINQAIGYASAIIDIYNSINNIEDYIVNLKDKIGKA
jgi:hypothetical protein